MCVGAYPGLGAEERGQAEAIAHNLREMARLQVPFIAVITGEGGSGGALAIAVADRVLMMENSIYSVISPEGCASIMWRDSTKKEHQPPRRCALPPRDNLETRLLRRGSFPSRPVVRITTTRPQPMLWAKHWKRTFPQLEKTVASRPFEGRYKKFRNMAQYFETVGTPA